MRIMRLTVGPLPPAVYWRRRAVVLGAGLLFLIVVLYSCAGSGSPRGTRGAASPSPSAGSTTAAPVPTGSGQPPATAAPSAGGDPGGAAPGGTGPVGGDTGDGAPAGGGTGPGTVPDAAAPAPNSCTDAEMSLVAVPSATTVKRGTPVNLKLRIKNVSDRTCSRDVGADLQELFVKSGAAKLWSSDTCGTARGSDVRSFPPDQENEYGLDWNGRDSSRCAGGVADGPFPEPGDYQLFARVGTKLSAPVKITVTG
jgi:hypothetical protein